MEPTAIWLVGLVAVAVAVTVFDKLPPPRSKPAAPLLEETNHIADLEKRADFPHEIAAKFDWRAVWNRRNHIAREALFWSLIIIGTEMLLGAFDEHGFPLPRARDCYDCLFRIRLEFRYQHFDAFLLGLAPLWMAAILRALEKR